MVWEYLIVHVYSNSLHTWWCNTMRSSWSELEISYGTANCLHLWNCHGNLHCLFCSHSFCSTAGDSTQLGVSDDKIMRCLVVWKCDIWWYETCNIWQYVVQQKCVFHGPNLKYLMMVQPIVFIIKTVMIIFIHSTAVIPSVVLLLMVHSLGYLIVNSWDV